MNEKKSAPIYLVPFEHIESVLLNYLVKELTDIFQANVIIEKKRALPKVTYNQYRDQYRANAFLEALQNMQLSGKVIGICDVDIYAKNLDFIFSIAEPETQVAIVSITRFKPIFYKMYQDESVFWLRVLKEMIHTLSRVYGLEHCYRQGCVMHLSKSIMDIDIKSDRFCGECRRLLQIALEKNETTDY